MDYAQTLKGGWAALLERSGWGNHNEPAVPAFAFLERAEEYVAAFAGMRPAAAETFDWPRYAMLYLAAEAALKGFLVGRGAPLRRVQRLGNNLRRLQRRAAARGFVLTDPTVRRLEDMSKARLDRVPEPHAGGCPDREETDLLAVWRKPVEEVLTTARNHMGVPPRDGPARP
jgi:hypothetical protein